MTNNGTRPYENTGNTNASDPTRGQDSTDSPTSDTPKTEIGSGGSTRTEGGQRLKGRDLDPDRTIWMPRGRRTNQETRIHLDADCQSLDDSARDLLARAMPDRQVCRYCLEGQHTNFQDWTQEYDCRVADCDRSYYTAGDRFRHEVLAHRGEDDDEEEAMTDGGGFQITLDRTHVRDGDDIKELWKATVDNADAYDDMGGETPGRALRALAREFDDVFGAEPRADGGRMAPRDMAQVITGVLDGAGDALTASERDRLITVRRELEQLADHRLLGAQPATQTQEGQR